MEDALRHLLLERMLLYRPLIDGDAAAGACVWPHQAAFWLDSESFLHHVLPPRHVVVDGLTNLEFVYA